MLIFHCTDCSEKIDVDDDESPFEILKKLAKHIRECPLSTFNPEGTTDAAWQNLNNLSVAIEGLRRKVTLH